MTPGSHNAPARADFGERLHAHRGAGGHAGPGGRHGSVANLMVVAATSNSVGQPRPRRPPPRQPGAGAADRHPLTHQLGLGATSTPDLPGFCNAPRPPGRGHDPHPLAGAPAATEPDPIHHRALGGLGAPHAAPARAPEFTTIRSCTLVALAARSPHDRAPRGRETAMWPWRGERRCSRSPRERQGGFSLIELLIAMTVTLVVSGAIYGLMAGARPRSAASRSWPTASRTSAWPWT